MYLIAERKRPSLATRTKRNPIVAHALRAANRYSTRLGKQFSAAITYFSVLALIPTLMFAFAALGFTLEVLRPDLLDTVKEQISETGGDSPVLIQLLDNYMSNWRTVGLVAVLSALYTAQGWIGNLKDAVRAMARDDLAEPQPQAFAVRLITNVVALVGVLLALLLAVGLSVVGTSLPGVISSWLNLPGWMSPVLVVVPILASTAACWVILIWLLTLLPAEPFEWRFKARAATIGAVASGILLNSATLLISAFSGSPTAALFGPIIAIMLAMNLFATIILISAAWLGTYERRSVIAPRTAPSAVPQGPPATSTSEMLLCGLAAIGIIAGTLVGLRRWENRLNED